MHAVLPAAAHGGTSAGAVLCWDAAAALYVDIVILFMRFVRIFGRR